MFVTVPILMIALLSFEPVPREMLCVTEGAIGAAPDGRMTVNGAKMRAYLNRASAQTLEARFTYLGPVAGEQALASGAARRQFGLKLKAQDACNLVYVMWRIEPAEGIVVSVKSNPAAHTSAECGNRGYQNLKPVRSSPVTPIQAGESHTLRAELEGSRLIVHADGKLAWEGRVDVAIDGPVGIRSDNVKLQFELGALQVDRKAASSCRSGPSAIE